MGQIKEGLFIDVYHVNNDSKLLAYHRWAENGGPGDSVVVILNFANQTQQNYRLNFPASGKWQLRFDSHYGGYDASFEGQVSEHVIEADGSQGAAIAIAPYSAIIYSQ